MGKTWSLGFLLLFVVGCATAPSPAPSAATVAGGILFQIEAPGASRVSVVGTFNGWDPAALPLRKTGGVWTRIVPLPVGRYQYMFVVDGRWVTPPQARQLVADGFGRDNGLLVVE